MATKSKKAAATRSPRMPEKKWGPFHGGLGVAVWLNETETATGRRFFRSVTIAPRRYLNSETGQWEDAGSLRPVDLPSLLLALQAAHAFVMETPLPGAALDGDVSADADNSDSGNSPAF